MPMWRCPHCGTPQAETARCWVCNRSSTACGTCRHFRRSVAASIGYCGLDRTRQPLTGAEVRSCWEGWPSGERADTALPIIVARTPDEHAQRDFVEVVATTQAGTDSAGEPLERPATPTRSPQPPDYGWSLWGDPDL